MNNLIRQTPLATYLNARDRACVGGTCKNARNAMASATNKASANSAFLEKALLVRGVLRAFVNKDVLMTELAWKAIDVFYSLSSKGASYQWAADFLHVEKDQVDSYDQIGVITMQTLLEKKIKAFDVLLLEMIKKLRQNKNNGNNTGRSTVTKLLGPPDELQWNFKRFEVVSDNVSVPTFYNLLLNKVTTTRLSQLVSAVRINTKINKAPEAVVVKKTNKKNKTPATAAPATAVRNGLRRVVPLNNLRTRRDWLQMMR